MQFFWLTRNVFILGGSPLNVHLKRVLYNFFYLFWGCFLILIHPLLYKIRVGYARMTCMHYILGVTKGQVSAAEPYG